MKNRFSRKVIVSIILIMIFGFVTAGCGTTPNFNPNPNPTPTTCTVMVTSQDGTVWGQAVYMDGTQQPSTILAPWGSIQIDNVSVGVRHNFAIIQGNTFSHIVFLTTKPGTNYVDFYWF